MGGGGHVVGGLAAMPSVVSSGTLPPGGPAATRKKATLKNG